MCSAYLRLRAMGVRGSFRTSFSVEIDIFARVVPHRAPSMGPMSSVPTAVACTVNIVRFDWNFPFQGSRAWLGIW